MAEYSTLDEEHGGSNRPPSSGGSKLRLPRLAKSPLANGTPSSLSQPLNSADETDGQDSTDPYFIFQQDLCNKLELVDEALAEFLRVVHQTDTAVNDHELKEAKRHLKRMIKSVEPVLGDVQATIQLVEKNRGNFEIENSELYERKALVSTSVERLNMARQEMNSEIVKEKMTADYKAKTLRRGKGQLNGGTENGRQQDEFIADSQARASLLLVQQDEVLEDLDVAVVRVGHMAENIHEEIGQQNKMLDEMDEDLANAEEQLGMVMGKLAKLLKTKDKCQLGTILSLIGVVIVLFLLVLYT